MNIDALAIVSSVICTICGSAMIGCGIYMLATLCRADRRSRSQLRRSLGTLEAQE